jgi:Flp pilus assembly protein TadG
MKTQIDFDGITRSLRRIVNRAATATEAHAETRSTGRRRCALLRNSEQGQAMVEFALIFPAMLAVLTAIVTFAVAFNNQLILTSAVGSGAQYLQTRRSTTSDPCGDVITAIEAAAPNFTAANIGLTVSINGTVESGNSCPSATSTLSGALSEPVTVTATYPCFLSIMSMAPAYGSKFISNCQLSAQVTEYEY